MKLAAVYLDMDGVLCDLVGAAMRTHAREDLLKPGAWPKGVYTLEDVLGISTAEFWEPIDARGVEWWARLRPYLWMRNLIKIARSVADEVAVLTKPHSTYACVAGKHQWLMAHFGEDFSDYILSPVKHHLAAPGRLLVDDCDANIEAWKRAGGIGVLLPQPWNSGEGTIHNVYTELARYAPRTPRQPRYTP